MRRRLVISIVSTVLITGLLLGIPLAIFSTLGIRERAESNAETRAQRTAEILVLREKQGLPNDVATLTPYTNPELLTTITFPDGTVEVLGAQQSGQVVTGRGELNGIQVSVQATVDSLVSPVRVLANIAVIIVLGMILALIVSVRRTRRLADMFDQMASDAARIGSGDLRPARRYGMPELDQVADSLDASTRRVAELVRTERDLVADVTHQLRTPLTAIGLRIDEVAEAAERGDIVTARIEVLAAQEQVDRLATVIDELMAASRRTDAQVATFFVDDVLRQQQEEWNPLYAAKGRTSVGVDRQFGPGPWRGRPIRADRCHAA